MKRLLPKGLIQAPDWRLDADDHEGPFNRSIACYFYKCYFYVTFMLLL